MDLLRNESGYLKARHAEFLQAARRLQIDRRNSTHPPKLWNWFLYHLGDTMIRLGKKVQCESQLCVEYSQIHA
jgi:hypothetical protein